MMKKFLYRVQEVKPFVSRDGDGYDYWSEEKYVIAKNRKNAMVKITTKENTNQIKLITTIKI